jgi:hypothetical protein
MKVPVNVRLRELRASHRGTCRPPIPPGVVAPEIDR